MDDVELVSLPSCSTAGRTWTTWWLRLESKRARDSKRVQQHFKVRQNLAYLICWWLCLPFLNSSERLLSSQVHPLAKETLVAVSKEYFPHDVPQKYDEAHVLKYISHNSTRFPCKICGQEPHKCRSCAQIRHMACAQEWIRVTPDCSTSLPEKLPLRNSGQRNPFLLGSRTWRAP